MLFNLLVDFSLSHYSQLEFATVNDKFKILGTVYIRTDWSHFAPESA